MSIRVSLSARHALASGLLTVCLGAMAFVVQVCNGEDPIPQGVIDELPPEVGTPDARHRPGQPCLVCHSEYGGAQPPLVIGGTVFKEDLMTGALIGAPGIRVEVYDSLGDFRVACSNSAGNFFIEKDDWEKITFPLKSFVGNAPRRMRSIIGREGSCANCHQLPPEGVAGTGADKDSPGVIIVEDGEESPMLCPGVP